MKNRKKAALARVVELEKELEQARSSGDAWHRLDKIVNTEMREARDRARRERDDALGELAEVQAELDEARGDIGKAIEAQEHFKRELDVVICERNRGRVMIKNGRANEDLLRTEKNQAHVALKAAQERIMVVEACNAEQGERIEELCQNLISIRHLTIKAHL